MKMFAALIHETFSSRIVYSNGLWKYAVIVNIFDMYASLSISYFQNIWNLCTVSLYDNWISNYLHVDFPTCGAYSHKPWFYVTWSSSILVKIESEACTHLHYQFKWVTPSVISRGEVVSRVMFYVAFPVKHDGVPEHSMMNSSIMLFTYLWSASSNECLYSASFSDSLVIEYGVPWSHRWWVYGHLPGKCCECFFYLGMILLRNLYALIARGVSVIKHWQCEVLIPLHYRLQKLFALLDSNHQTWFLPSISLRAMNGQVILVCEFMQSLPLLAACLDRVNSWDPYAPECSHTISLRCVFWQVQSVCFHIVTCMIALMLAVNDSEVFLLYTCLSLHVLVRHVLLMMWLSMIFRFLYYKCTCIFVCLCT
jgi:hypothetical protein